MFEGPKRVTVRRLGSRLRSGILVWVFRAISPTTGLAYEQSKRRSKQEEKSRPENSIHWRVVLVGAGNIAETHASVLSGFRDAQVVAVLDSDQDRAQRFAQRWGIPKTLSHIDELSGSPAIADVVHVLVPP